jgi:putative membrane protein
MVDESKQEMAQDRTDWALERTLLAKERTFSAWGRTGIAAVAAGLATARLLGSVEPAWLALTVGMLLICTGGVIFTVGFLSYRKALDKLAERGVRGSPLWIILVITLVLMASAVLSLLLIFTD